MMAVKMQMHCTERIASRGGSIGGGGWCVLKWGKWGGGGGGVEAGPPAAREETPYGTTETALRGRGIGFDGSGFWQGGLRNGVVDEERGGMGYVGVIEVIGLKAILVEWGRGGWEM